MKSTKIHIVLLEKLSFDNRRHRTHVFSNTIRVKYDYYKENIYESDVVNRFFLRKKINRS